MNSPSVSIIIPSFNQGAYIERTLLSILKQDYNGQLEIIVSDGGSTDETIEVLKKYPQITWWSEPDKGFVDAVTKGLDVAKGEILAIQSSDDFYLKDAFKSSIGELMNNQELGVVTGCDVLLQPDLKTFVASSLESSYITPASLLLERTIPQHGAFFRRSVLTKIGGLRSQVDTCADTDFWYRALHFYKAKFIPRYTSVYQKHPNQRTKVLADWAASFIRMIELCELDPFYSNQFMLSEQDKKNLYARYEVFWGLHTATESQDKSLFLPKINQVLLDDDYTYATKKAVYRTATSHGLAVDPLNNAKLAQSLIRSLSASSAIKKLNHSSYQLLGALMKHFIDINWCR